MKTMYLGTKMQYIAETTIPSVVTLSQLRTQTLSYQGTPRGNKVFLNIYFSFYFSHHHLFPSIYFVTLKVFLILRLKSYLIYLFGSTKFIWLWSQFHHVYFLCEFSFNGILKEERNTENTIKNDIKQVL